jgi:hypothetical protein
MTELLKRHKAILWVLLFLSPILWLGITGVHQHLLAGTDRTYEELKVFSDVLDIIAIPTLHIYCLMRTKTFR